VLRRLREHGLIKKVRGTFKYYLTAFGRRVIATGLKLDFIVKNPADLTACK
jgi:hypothetical protein